MPNTMRMLSCLVFVSLLACAWSLKCITQIRTEVDEEYKEAAASEGMVSGDSVPGSCSTPQWCAKVVFDSTAINGVPFKLRGEQSDCATVGSGTFTKLQDKCNEIGDDCQELNDIEMKKDKHMKGDFIVCCCNTDFCNGSGTAVMSVFVLLLTAFCYIFAQ